MFRGMNGLSLDSKGRIAIPNKIRERLRQHGGDKLILTLHFRACCLLLYPIVIWEQIETRLIDLPSLDPVVDNLRKSLIGYAQDLEPDSQGRILIPQHLRDKATLEKKVLLVGQGNKYELWNERAWEQRETAWLEEASQGVVLPEALEGLSF